MDKKEECTKLAKEAFDEFKDLLHEHNKPVLHWVKEFIKAYYDDMHGVDVEI